MTLSPTEDRNPITPANCTAETIDELNLIKQQLEATNEQLKQLGQLKSLLLSMASHDLRTPLTSINGYANLILDLLPDDVHPSIPDYLTIVMRQAGRLNGLISDLVDLDEIETGRLKLNLEPFDFRDVVEEVTNLMQVNADNRGTTLETTLPEKPLVIWADRDKLYRVVYNLVENAIKYTPAKGQIKVKARLDSDKVVLDVADNGRGLTEEQLASLFQLYCHAEDARQNKTQTSEPGLYLIKKLVEAHEGHVKVASHPERGSIFTIYLPFATKK